MKHLNLKSVTTGLLASVVISGIFASSASAAITIPGAPTNVTATAGEIYDGAYTATPNATITFVPPANNGGAIITNYTVSCTPTCTPASGAASPIKIANLTSGTSYTFTVKATNSVGTGPASVASNSAPKCDGALPSYGYVGELEVYSYKVNGGSSIGNCDPAAGCDGYIGVPLHQCSNKTGAVTYAYLLTGPAYDNALVDLVYHQKQSGKMASYYYKAGATMWGGRVISGSSPVR